MHRLGSEIYSLKVKSFGTQILGEHNRNKRNNLEWYESVNVAKITIKRPPEGTYFVICTRMSHVKNALSCISLTLSHSFQFEQMNLFLDIQFSS